MLRTPPAPYLELPEFQILSRTAITTLRRALLPDPLKQYLEES